MQLHKVFEPIHRVCRHLTLYVQTQQRAVQFIIYILIQRTHVFSILGILGMPINIRLRHSFFPLLFSVLHSKVFILFYFDCTLHFFFKKKRKTFKVSNHHAINPLCEPIYLVCTQYSTYLGILGMLIDIHFFLFPVLHQKVCLTVIGQKGQAQVQPFAGPVCRKC